MFLVLVQNNLVERRLSREIVELSCFDRGPNSPRSMFTSLNHNTNSELICYQEQFSLDFVGQCEGGIGGTENCGQQISEISPNQKLYRIH